jgi:hypothetical protein
MARLLSGLITLAKMAGGTDGNIISYDASGDPVAIATGDDGEVLTSAGAGSPPAFEDAFGTGPAFSAYKSDNQTIANNTLTKVLFETEDFDTNSDFASSTFTPTVAGYYVLSAMVILGSGSFSRLHLHIYKNGSTHRRIINQEATSAILDDWSGHGSLLVYANGSSDYFEVWMDQRANSSADNLGAGSGSMRSWFTGHMVRTA